MVVVAQTNGAKNYRLARIYLHRQYIITGIVALILLVPLLSCKQIMLALGLPADVVEYAARYIHICIPGVILNGFGIINSVYCNHLEGKKCILTNGICSNLTHIVVLILLLGVFDMGFDGICITMSLSLSARWVGSMLYMRFTSNKKITDHNTEPFFTRLTIQHLGYQVKICLVQCMMNVWPVWGFELYTMMAGYISTTAMAAQSILRASSLLVFLFPFGIRMAALVNVGKCVGSK